MSAELKKGRGVERLLRSLPVRALAAIYPVALGSAIWQCVSKGSYVTCWFIAVGAVGALAAELCAIDRAHAWFRSTLAPRPTSPGGTET